jgi:hypothetical protein
MLRVIEYYHQHHHLHHPLLEDDEEDAAVVIDFVRIMEEMEQQQSKTNHNHSIFRIATPEQTQIFGGVSNIILQKDNQTGIEFLNHLPMVVAGTHPQLSHPEREILLKHCPELKIIFPSLHEPSCFGARHALDPIKCKTTICALAQDIPSHGC